MPLKEYDSVRICRLLVPERPFDGTEGVARPPRSGDTGTVVATGGRGTEKTWVVESVNAEGKTVWLADFRTEELEKIPDGIGRPTGPGLPTCLVGILLGAGSAYAVASCWLGLAPAWLALTVGAVTALYGVFSLATLVEAGVLAVILGVIAAVLIAVPPGVGLVKAVVAAGACGVSAGKIVVGLRQEVFS